MRLKSLNKFLGNSGLSLVGLLIGASLLSFVFLAAGYMMAQTKSVEMKTEFRANLDRTQLLTIQKTRSSKFLKKNLAIDPLLPGANIALINCLKGRGTACRSTAAVPQSYQEILAAREDIPCGSGNCQIQSRAHYKINCDSDKSCQSVRVKINSDIVATGDIQNFAKPRESIFLFPALLLTGAKDMNFDCAQSRSMTGLDFATRVALCSQAPATECGGLRPIGGMNAADCPSLENVNCPKGAASVGLMQSQSVCH